MKTKTRRRAVVAVTTEAAPVPVPSQMDEEIDARREATTEARNAGTLKGTLIEAVKVHARKHYEDGTGWDVVLETMSDADIWEVIQWCDFERGAVGMMARKVKRLTVADEATGVQVTA